jgi:uncharacterized protein YndB with AHSA1/START domain
MELDKNAPVTHSANIEINAPVDRVWQIMADIEHWPEWNKGIKSASLNGNLESGTTFVWKSGPGTITSRLEAVEQPKTLAWSGQMMGIKAAHIWRLEKALNGTLVTTEESWSGLLPSILKSYSKKTLVKAINSGLELLKQTAERE